MDTEINTEEPATSVSEESENGAMWSDAQEAFNNPETENDSDQSEDTTAQDSVQKSEPGHEPDLEALLNLDDLKVPQKYKGYVKDRLEKLQANLSKKVDSESKTAKEMQEASQALIRTFQEIAKNPTKLPEYVEQYGNQFGLDAETINKYRTYRTTSEKKQETQADTFGAVIKGVFEKYNKTLSETKDPEQFLQTLNLRDTEMINSVKNEMLGIFKQILTGYHEKIIDPNLQTLRGFKEQSTKAINAGRWNDAKDVVSGKYEDFGKYEVAIINKLRDDPMFASYRNALNANADELAAKGITHEKVVETVYHLLSKQDHLKVAQEKIKPKIGGLPPNQKRMETRPISPDGFDDLMNQIKKEEWDDD